MNTAKIKAIEGIREWAGPNGTVYYFKLSMDNGDLGEIGKKKADAVKVGDSLTYTIEATQYGNKFKEVREGFGAAAGKPKGSLAAFALSYAKDISVAQMEINKNPDITVDMVATKTMGIAKEFLNWMRENENG